MHKQDLGASQLDKFHRALDQVSDWNGTPPHITVLPVSYTEENEADLIQYSRRQRVHDAANKCVVAARGLQKGRLLSGAGQTIQIQFE